MLEEKSFKGNELIRAEYQFLIRHQTSDNFIIGETVFLVSNPEVPLIVHSIKNNTVLVYWYANNEIQFSEFPPQCVLQYKYRPLLVHYKTNFNICLN